MKKSQKKVADSAKREKMTVPIAHQARKIGGIWVDPMSFPSLTDYNQS